MKETILVFLILLNGMACLACGCSTMDLDEAIEDADEIFVGNDLNLYYDVRHPNWHKRPDWFALWVYRVCIKSVTCA